MSSFFKDIADVKSNLPGVHAQMAVDDLFPYLVDGDEKYIIPFIGQDFYDEITAELEGVDWVVDDLAADLVKVATFLRKASGFYGSYEAFPYLNVNIANIGLVSHQAEGSQPLRQWEYKEVQANSIRRGDEYLDRALAILEADPDSYASWSGDEVFTMGRELLINNARDFRVKGKLNIGDSRRTFMSMRPYIQKTEDRYIADCMGATLLASIKAKILAGTALEAKETILLDSHILPGLAHWAMVQAAPELKLDISTQGIRMVSTNDGITSYGSPESTFKGRDAYEEWKRELYNSAVYYMSKAKMYLEDNASDFPDYESDAASEQSAHDYKMHDNSSSQSSFMV